MPTIHQFIGHVGGTHEPFLGDPDQCGYTRARDEPDLWRDARGNTGRMASWAADPAEPDDVRVLLGAWDPDGTAGPDAEMAAWLVREHGCSPDQAGAWLTAMNALAG